MPRPPLLPPTLAALSLILIASKGGAHAQTPNPLPSWTLVHQSKPDPIVPGVTYIKKSIAASSALIKSGKTLHLITFDTRVATLKLIDQGNDPKKPAYLNLADAMQQNFCIAGCNGGYFMEDFSPGGLTITGGKHIGKFTNHSLYSGTVVVQSNGSMRLLWQDEVNLTPDIKELLQAGPRLVLEGKPKILYDWNVHRNRTFILTDGGSQWAIGLCTTISLPDLALALANPEIISELKVWRALNLDGGTSSSLYFSRGAGKRPFDFTGFKPVVRNYLSIAPR
jgi:uncharacterized protein YigE (DUF2233 family)